MNRMLAAATTAILVTACSAAPEQAWEEKSQSKGACNVEIRSQLRDPSSFQAIRHICLRKTVRSWLSFVQKTVLVALAWEPRFARQHQAGLRR
jgi:hypothetical protein